MDLPRGYSNEESVKQREFSTRLLKVQDEERRRIARELHDDLGELLAVMRINAGRVAREKLKLSAGTARCAQENVRLIKQVSNGIRTMPLLFHPPSLDEWDWVPRCTGLARINRKRMKDTQNSKYISRPWKLKF